jgi:hypothetical protein
MKIEFDRIVSYGCSVTSGFELADTLIFADKSQQEIDRLKIKLGIEGYIKEIEKIIPPIQVSHLESTRSWIRFLAEKLNVDYVSRAVPGGCCQSSVYFLERDLSTGFIRDTDMIIVGHTEHSRWFWIDNNGQPRYPCIGGTNDRWPSSSFHKDFVAYVGNEHHLSYHWFNGIKYLDMLSTRLDNRIFQQFCLDPVYTLTDKLRTFDSIIDHDYSFSNIVDWSNKEHIHVFQHPKIEFHEIFAEHIHKKLIEKMK